MARLQSIRAWHKYNYGKNRAVIDISNGAITVESSAQFVHRYLILVSEASRARHTRTLVSGISASGPQSNIDRIRCTSTSAYADTEWRSEKYLRNSSDPTAADADSRAASSSIAENSVLRDRVAFDVLSTTSAEAVESNLPVSPNEDATEPIVVRSTRTPQNGARMRGSGKTSHSDRGVVSRAAIPAIPVRHSASTNRVSGTVLQSLAHRIGSRRLRHYAPSSINELMVPIGLGSE